LERAVRLQIALRAWLLEAQADHSAPMAGRLP
jgi:hypothetical protein